MIVYLAGPMRGYPRYNFDRFEEASQQLRALGYTVLSPHQMDLDVGFNPDGNLDGFSIEDAVRRDVEAIIKCDMVVFLEGWINSVGARAEYAIACWLKKQTQAIEDICQKPDTNSQPGLCAIGTSQAANHLLSRPDTTS